MAAVGAGRHAQLSDGVMAMTAVERSFEPNPRFRARYDAMYDAFLRALDALRPIGRIGF